MTRVQKSLMDWELDVEDDRMRAQFMRRASSVAGFVCLAVAWACETAILNHNPVAHQASMNRAPVIAETPSCGDDCFAILRAAVSWVSETRSVPPARLVLDTVRSGRSSYNGPLIVPRSALNDLTTAAGIGRGAADAQGRCFGGIDMRDDAPPISASCRPLEDKLMVTLSAPIVSGDSPTEASVDVGENWTDRLESRAGWFWAWNVYRLTLKRGATGWRVVAGQLILES